MKIQRAARAEVKKVNARIAALEARPEVKHVGAWRAARTFNAGELVQHDGSCWFAKKVSTGIAPGSTKDHWVLVAKRGAKE